MGKLRVYELAKQYGMKGPEMAEVLRKLGFDKVKSHMAVLDEADQMMVSARLEAQGLQARPATDADATPGKPKKKKLPTKKSLPPAAATATKDLPRKKLPAKKSATGATSDTGGAAAAAETQLEPEVAAQAEAAPAEAVAEAAPAEVAPVEAAPPEAAPEETPAEVAEAPAEVAAEQQEVEAEPEAEAEAEPEAEAAKAGEEGGPAVAEEEKAGPDEGEEGGEQGKSVKRLLVPKAKARVVRRIQLPEATIRDATRRSAPSGPRQPGAVDGSLRRAALQHTQSRTASRTGPGQRRGPGRGGPRPGPRGRGGSDVRGQKRKKTTGIVASSTVDPDKIIEIEPPISVKKLSEALGAKVNALVAMMTFKLDIKGKTINSFLSEEEVELIAMELERNVKIVETKEAEEELIESLVEQTADISQDVRAPVVTFMGHVDHGKTTLLDKLRASDVTITEGEAGGITQHIGAYKITTSDDQSFVVLDTPGHAAFTAMRARGANITDVVVLVVAADDGVMPQTEEAIAHAKEAKVPIVVAVNKCDLPGAKPEQVRQQLAVKGLQPEEWGGDVGFVNVSAVTGEGLDALVERILLEAEVAELAAKPLAPGSGVVIESRQSAEQGIVVNALVMDGTLAVKDQIICGESYSRVRGLTDDHGRQIEAAGPATPVSMLGLHKLPQPGDKFFVVGDAKKAKEVIEDRQRRARARDLAERTAVTLETLGATIAAQEVSEIKVILKADVMGSLEPIRNSLAELGTDEVRFNIIHHGLGAITDSDVTLAAASEAVIIGFNTVPDATARQIADRMNVEIRFYDVIYTLIDEMKLALEGLLKPDEIENVHGQAEVRAVFKSSKFGNIAGCYVTDGLVNRNSRVRLIRNGKVIHTGTIASLRRVQDDVREVKSGFECGLTITNYSDVKVGDELTFFEVELVKRKLD